MKVLYFHQHFTTPRGSGGTRSYEMARALVRLGHDVTLVCGSRSKADTGVTAPYRRGKREGSVDGFTVIEIKLAYSNYQSILKRAFVFLRFGLRSIMIALTRQYDVVFCTSTPLTASLPGVTASVFRRKPFVFEVRDLWPELPRAMGVITNPVVLWCLGILERISYRAAKACIGLSPGIVESIAESCKRGKIVEMIPNGCDTDSFKPMPDIQRDLQGVRDDDFVAVFSGAHGKANGLDAVLDAAAVLKARGVVDIKLLFIGDGKEKPHLVQRAKDESLDICIFMPYMPKDDLPRVLNMTDAGMQILDNVPAFYNGTSPNKFFDYISTGIPVINNYPGWLAELITTHGCGIAVPPEDPSAFADALIKLRDDEVGRREMGRRARELAVGRFGRRESGEAFTRVLENAFDGPVSDPATC